MKYCDETYRLVSETDKLSSVLTLDRAADIGVAQGNNPIIEIFARAVEEHGEAEKGENTRKTKPWSVSKTEVTRRRERVYAYASALSCLCGWTPTYWLEQVSEAYACLR